MNVYANHLGIITSDYSLNASVLYLGKYLSELIYI